MTKFTEDKLEQAIIALLEHQGYPHHSGGSLERYPTEALLKDDLRTFLAKRYAGDAITAAEIEVVIGRLDKLPAADLYDSNKAIHKLVADGLLLKREPLVDRKHRSQKDLYIQLIDYSDPLEQCIPGENEGFNRLIAFFFGWLLCHNAVILFVGSAVRRRLSVLARTQPSCTGLL